MTDDPDRGRHDFHILYRGYKVRDRLTERLLSSFTVF